MPHRSPDPTRTCLITGGASGIGQQLAELLAARGERVVTLDLAPGADLQVDVRDGDAVKRAIGEVGLLGLVVNSAGIQSARVFDELDEDEFRRIVEVNLIGSRNVAAATLPQLRESRGHLVLVASLAGLVANYGYAAYCASKYGVVGLAEVLRLEEKRNGVTVSCVCPPEVETPMVQKERLTQPAPSKALKAFAGTMELEPAARAILRGIDREDFLILPGRARRTRIISRVLPQRAAHAVSDRIVRRAR